MSGSRRPPYSGNTKSPRVQDRIRSRREYTAAAIRQYHGTITMMWVYPGHRAYTIFYFFAKRSRRCPPKTMFQYRELPRNKNKSCPGPETMPYKKEVRHKADCPKTDIWRRNTNTSTAANPAKGRARRPMAIGATDIPLSDNPLLRPCRLCPHPYPSLRLGQRRSTPTRRQKPPAPGGRRKPAPFNTRRAKAHVAPQP